MQAWLGAADELRSMVRRQDLSWAAGKKYMGNVDAFLKSLLAFDKDNVPVPCVDRAERDYISNPAFSADNIRSKSAAAAGLCAWVINICKYFRIYQARHDQRVRSAAAVPSARASRLL